MKIIICFAPYSGGNHVKNILNLNEENFDYYKQIYTRKEKKQGGVHEVEGRIPNLTKEKYQENNIVNGHYGEVMSIREDVQQTDNKKWILISPDTYECRSIIYKRSRAMTSDGLILDGYYDLEQVFLYEPHMIHNYFGSEMKDIMNISVYELFSDDINLVLDRIDFFLPFELDKDKARYLHKIWRETVRVEMK
jgi:hypothetical protein|tara:strand:+ start:807 stop:1385 length:579 start_codon:yes stop_codon:yes gene_type:complete